MLTKIRAICINISNEDITSERSR